MKKLPRVVAIPISKKINRNKTVFYSSDEPEHSEERKDVPLVFGKRDTDEIIDKINEVFHSTHHSFHVPVVITLKDKKIETRLAGKFGNKLLTMDDEEILISDIVDFKIKESK